MPVSDRDTYSDRGHRFTSRFDIYPVAKLALAKAFAIDRFALLFGSHRSNLAQVACANLSFQLSDGQIWNRLCGDG